MTPPTLDVTTNNYSDATPTIRLHIRLLGCTFDYLAAPTDYLAAVNDNPAVVIDYSAAAIDNAATNQAKSRLIFYIFTTVEGLNQDKSTVSCVQNGL